MNPSKLLVLFASARTYRALVKAVGIVTRYTQYTQNNSSSFNPTTSPPKVMSARYAALPNPRSVPDTEQELEDAFGLANEDDDDENTPLTRNGQQPPANTQGHPNPVPGAYDFEREYGYDYPPPGSPPRPSAFALPNDIGNSNGELPSSPVRLPMPRLSLFRRTVGAILPTHYVQVHAESSHGRPLGGGLENDGVFANVTAKPQRTMELRTETGEAYLVPEDSQKDVPPVRISSLVVFPLITQYNDGAVICRSPVRLGTTVLGNDSTRSFWAYLWLPYDH